MCVELAATTYPMPCVDDLINTFGKAKYVYTRARLWILASTYAGGIMTSDCFYDSPISCDAVWSSLSVSYIPSHDGSPPGRLHEFSCSLLR